MKLNKLVLLKTWIVLAILVVLSELGRVFYFLATHYGYGENGVNTITEEFIYQLQYAVYPTWSEDAYVLMIISGIIALIVAKGVHPKSE